MNHQMLKQARQGFENTIRKEGIQLTLKTYPLIDNGFGTLIEDLSQPAEESKIIARVQLDMKGPVQDMSGTTGMSSNLSRCIFTSWRNPVTEKTIIEGLEREYIIDVVTPLIKFGGIYGYQAVIKEGTE